MHLGCKKGDSSFPAITFNPSPHHRQGCKCCSTNNTKFEEWISTPNVGLARHQYQGRKDNHSWHNWTRPWSKYFVDIFPVSGACGTCYVRTRNEWILWCDWATWVSFNIFLFLIRISNSTPEWWEKKKDDLTAYDLPIFYIINF